MLHWIFNTIGIVEHGQMILLLLYNNLFVHKITRGGWSTFFFCRFFSKRVWVIMENWVYKSKCKNLTVIITIIASIAVGFLRWFRWNKNHCNLCKMGYLPAVRIEYRNFLIVTEIYPDFFVLIIWNNSCWYLLSSC